MNIEQLVSLFSALSLVVVVAYFIGRNKFLIYCVKHPENFKCFISLLVIFTTLSVIGTYTGVKIHGALANTRMVGTLMGGFLGGPVVGTCVGLISGLFRMYVGGFTGPICGSVTIIVGICAGFMRKKIGLNKLNWKVVTLTAFIMEVLQKAAIILLAKPFEAAVALEKSIALPTTLVTVVGSYLCIIVIEDVKKTQLLYGGQAAKMSLDIASRTIPYLRHGLTGESAQKTAQIIYELTQVSRVVITDTENVLASVGDNNNHKVQFELVKRAVAEHRTLTANEANGKDEVIFCSPLIVHGATVGTIYLMRLGDKDMAEIDTHIVDGLAKLLSVQVQLAEIDAQKKMREKAELQALQAQINPHFLFNTINIIMSFCRTSPDTARSLLAHLATMLHRSFTNRGDFITLKEELAGVNAYLEIVKARFGERLTIETDIDTALMNFRIPILCLQPLVENAIQHGLFPKLTECILKIAVYRKNELVIIEIKDNGIGIPNEKLHRILSAASAGIGLKNVNSRVKSIYGAQYGLDITSSVNNGTSIRINLPAEGGINAA